MGPDREIALRTALADYNRAGLAEFEAETGLRYLGDDGPVYLAGSVRVRALFIDGAGSHWCDGRLAAESAYSGTHAVRDWASVVGERLDSAHDLWITTTERGRHDAIIAPISDVCAVLDLDPPELFAPGWARSWRTFDWMVESTALALAAAGGSGEPGLFDDRRPTQ